ncbi:MAG: hypothetical protein ACRDHN_03330, partial [Thermomicrobiales bacterium]
LEFVAVGAGAPVEFPFVSESAILERYRRAARVVVVDEDRSWYTSARSMLAVASGSETWRVSSSGTLESVDVFTDAHGQMTRLVRMIEARRPPALFARPPSE